MESKSLRLGDEMREKSKALREKTAKDNELGAGFIWHRLEQRIRNATKEEVEKSQIDLKLAELAPIDSKAHPFYSVLLQLCDGAGVVFHRRGCTCEELGPLNPCKCNSLSGAILTW